MRLNGEALSLSRQASKLLATGESVAREGGVVTLDGLAERAQVKVSRKNVTTESRRGMIYDSRGRVDTYRELAFSGTRLSVNGMEREWRDLSEKEKEDVVLEEADAELLDAGSLSITAATPESVPSASSITGMPPPPTVITIKPRLSRSLMMSISMILTGRGEGTTRR